MPKLKIDLATRILSDDMEVHLVHPGARYAFYDDVLDNGVLPVDVPFLDIPDGQPVPDAEDIAPMLERAREMRRWAKRPMSEAEKVRPPIDIDFYRTGLNIEAGAQGARTRLRNAANDVLWTIPDESLVVVPTRRISEKAILVELGAKTDERIRVPGTGHYAGLKFLGRPVKVINTVPMLALPGSVLNVARSTSPVHQIDGHEEDKILRLAYGDYQRNHEYVAGVVAQTDDFDALVMGQMIDLHIALEHFLNTGVALPPGRGLYDPSVTNTPFMHANINSPDGRASLESRSIATFSIKLLAIVAASGLSLTFAGNLIAAADILVENSADPYKDVEMLRASANALVDFFSTSGHTNSSEYLAGLENGLRRNATLPQGTATIEP